MRELFFKLFEMSHFNTGIKVTAFSIPHFVYLALIFGGIIGGYFYLRRKDDAVKEKGYGIYLLSDYPECFEYNWESFELFDMFDGRAVSYELHARKRERTAFPLLLERYNLRAEECFFVDDLYLNTDAAKECGLGAHLFTTTENLRKELKELGVL